LQTQLLPKHLYSLDVLRGIAALAVVFWHWKHFLVYGTGLDLEFINFPELDYDRQPLFPLFEPFYSQGIRAVDLFFCISGFVFYWLYSNRVREGEVDLRQFSVLRFSRLYPLHFVTLITVASLQAFILVEQGRFFIFETNDFYHFILSLFFLSGLGLGSPYSFNAPVWSVSAEVLVYFLFFAACRRGWARPWQLAFFVSVGFLLQEASLPANFDAYGGRVMIGRCVAGFFIGGLTFYLARYLLKRGLSRGFRVAIFGLSIFLWWAAPDRHLGLFYTVVLYPMTLLSLVMLETWVRLPLRRLSWLGDISYSIYLIHFPLQILLVIMLPLLGMNPDFFFTPTALFAFFGVLIALGLASFHWLERPAEEWLRNRLLERGNP